MASKLLPQRELHFVLVPFMAQGHLLPMTDIAKLLAQHGVVVTIITTPVNAGRIRGTVSRAVESTGVQITVAELELPSDDGVGLLPKHCETLDQLPSLGQGAALLYSVQALEKPMEKLFEELRPRPNCVISDVCLPFTSTVARKFGVPRITFNGFSAFTLLCLRNIHQGADLLESEKGVLATLSSDSERFVVPGLPDRVEVTMNQLPIAMAGGLDRLGERVVEAEGYSYGMIVNSFEELEQEYFSRYKAAMGGKAWSVGPVSSCNKDRLDRFERGNPGSTINESECLKWLDSQECGSVIYVCMGSLCNIPTPQLIELGLGLEAWTGPFVWVVREGETSKGLLKWMEDYSFEEKTKGRGLIVRGWAPQMVILSHPAVDGFLTHCGWNSTLEGICAGLPMVTWPLFGDQFLNERLVVDVLKIGVPIGAEATLKWGEEEKTRVLIEREDVRQAIEELMGGGDEKEMRRKRAKEFSEKSKLVLEEGGSSYLNIELLIQDIMQHTSKKCEEAMLSRKNGEILVS
ncbi:unnamed protein product [Linum tenue]|uniref:Glycosyltransferase n=1 Tax=Linum tenue TaxID=586396 RepID=A0AAV0JCI5_9ROSI|nr:unnamed protein product [Linum tenue]